MYLSDLITGGLSAIVSRTATAPLELFKLQRQNSFMPYSTIREVAHREGLSYLWKGNGTNCMRAFPQFSINYAIFRQGQQRLPIQNEELRNLASGVISGITAITCIYPLETIRSRLSLQTNHNHYSSMSDALKKLKFKEMYGGLRMSIMGFGPYNALSFTFYYRFKDKLQTNYLAPSTEELLAGGLSGLAAISFTYPTDLIRRRLQLQGFDPAVPEYKGIRDCATQILRREGLRGLYRGLLASYIKLFPTTAIQFWTIEKCNQQFKNKN